ncbi:MAG: hypothetical protein ACE5HT_13775 [Gemmatimonadales bacterium]
MIRCLAGLMLSLATVLVCANPLAAQATGAHSDGLELGPYAVGYRVLYALDRSRVWDAVSDSLTEQEFYRPVRISVWYPAEDAGDASVMTYGEFLHDEAPNQYFRQLNDLLARRFVEIIRLGLPDLSEESLFGIGLTAIHHATPVSGTFPLVTYSPGGGSTLPDNFTLASYLVSHGYVVASVPEIPFPNGRVRQTYQAQTDEEARDVAFAIGVLGGFPSVNRRKLATTGFSRGGLVALKVAIDNPNVDAVVGLDPSYAFATTFERITESSQVDAYAFRIPVLTLLRTTSDSNGSAPRRFLLDSLHYADRYVGRVTLPRHSDFAEIRSMLYPALRKNSDQPSLTAGQLGYAAAARYMLEFLNAALKDDPRGFEFAARSSNETDLADQLVAMNVMYAADILTEDELVGLLDREGYDAAVQRVRTAMERYPNLLAARPKVLNRIGHDLLNRQELDLAAQVFRLSLEVYPQSVRAYEGLAAIYVALGNSEQLMWAYEHLLDVLPGDSSLSRRQRDRYRQDVGHMLRLLKLKK